VAAWHQPVVQEPHALQVGQDILAISEISKFYTFYNEYAKKNHAKWCKNGQKRRNLHIKKRQFSSNGGFFYIIRKPKV
jgi:hypothetical protein